MKAIPPRIWPTVLLVLLVIGVVLLALSGFLRPVIKVVTDPLISIQGWLSARYSAVVDFMTVPRDVATLSQRNTELENQIAELQSQNIEMSKQLEEMNVLTALLDFRRTRPENQYVAAAVIGRDPSPFLQYVYIDHGSDDGLRHGMPVVTEKGLVGRVDAITAGAARIQLIGDSLSSVNVHVKSSNINLLAIGSVTGDVTLQMVPQDLTLHAGDLVLTSGLGGNYPADILIGQVVNIRKRGTDLFQTATIQPAIDFANLKAVLIITNYKSVDISPLTPTLAP